LLAARSRRVTDELHDTRPGWLRTISAGANLILVSIVWAAVWPAIYHGALDWRWGNPMCLYWGFTVAGVGLFVGVWLLTRREGYEPADRADVRLRIGLRIAAAGPIVGVLLKWISAEIVAGRSGVFTMEPGIPALDWPAFFLLTIGMAPLPFMIFLRLRGLAKRARSAHLAEHCLIVGIGSAAAVLFAAGVIEFLCNNIDRSGPYHDWIITSNVWLGVMTGMFVTCLLFLLWSFYLLVRFAIAFRIAAGRLRGKWARDDRGEFGHR